MEFRRSVDAINKANHAAHCFITFAVKSYRAMSGTSSRKTIDLESKALVTAQRSRNSICFAFAVVGAEQRGVEAFTIKQALQRDVADLRAVIRHGDPRDMIYIARPILVKGSTCQAVNDSKAAFTLKRGTVSTF